MPSKCTFKCGGLLSQGPSPNHHGVAPMVAWNMSLNVGLGSIFDLNKGLRKGAQGHCP